MLPCSKAPAAFEDEEDDYDDLEGELAQALDQDGPEAAGEAAEAAGERPPAAPPGAGLQQQQPGDQLVF